MQLKKSLPNTTVLHNFEVAEKFESSDMWGIYIIHHDPLNIPILWSPNYINSWGLINIGSGLFIVFSKQKTIGTFHCKRTFQHPGAAGRRPKWWDPIVSGGSLCSLCLCCSLCRSETNGCWYLKKWPGGLDFFGSLKKIIWMFLPTNSGTSKWMVHKGKPYLDGWFGGTTIFGNTRKGFGWWLPLEERAWNTSIFFWKPKFYGGLDAKGWCSEFETLDTLW